MTWFTPTEKYVREVESPGGDKAEVTFRVLNAGDMAAIQDLMRMSFGDDDNHDAALLIGTMRQLTVQKAVVDWTIPGPKPTPESIAQLEPDVFDQLYGHAQIGAAKEEVPPTNGAGETAAKRKTAAKSS
jgi:hypothetical protein